METQFDSVNHPPHYNSHPSGVECIDIIEHHSLCIGNAIKYLWRAGLKGKSTLPVTWLYLDFTGNHQLEEKLWEFKKQNQIYPIQAISGFSGLHKESYCYSPEDAIAIVDFIGTELMGDKQ